MEEHDEEYKEICRQVGHEMIKMTTCLWYRDEYLAVPFIWDSVMKERDSLREELSKLKGKETV